jgi:hypothetical protein
MINQRAREDEEILASLPTKEEAEKAFKKFNKDRDEEAFKIYSDYIEKRDKPIPCVKELEQQQRTKEPEQQQQANELPTDDRNNNTTDSDKKNQ